MTNDTRLETLLSAPAGLPASLRPTLVAPGHGPECRCQLEAIGNGRFHCDDCGATLRFCVHCTELTDAKPDESGEAVCPCCVPPETERDPSPRVHCVTYRSEAEAAAGLGTKTVAFGSKAEAERFAEGKRLELEPAIVVEKLAVGL